MTSFRKAFLPKTILLCLCLFAGIASNSNFVSADDEASPPPKDETQSKGNDDGGSSSGSGPKVEHRASRPLAKEVPMDTFDAASHFDWGTYYDPKNVFCGQYDCYGILGFDYENFDREKPSKKMITKRYRSLSRHWHPDKSKHPGAKERFQVRKTIQRNRTEQNRTEQNRKHCRRGRWHPLIRKAWRCRLQSWCSDFCDRAIDRLSRSLFLFRSSYHRYCAIVAQFELLHVVRIAVVP